MVTITTPDDANQIELNFATSHQFQNPSPTQRIFLVSQPVSFYINNGALFRYANYGFIASQPAVLALPASRPQRAMLGGTGSSATPFSYQQATLARNGIVALDVTFHQAQDSLKIHQTLQVRNVP